MSMVPTNLDLLLCEGIKNKVDIKIFFSVIQRQKITIVYKLEMVGVDCFQI
jgi:hypothetical protein